MSELTVQKPRQSNIELFRILLMLMIIGGHYVMNGGLSHTFDPNHITWQTLFLESFSWEGKMAINGFLLITSFFMCQQMFKIQKFWKLMLMIMLYNWGGYILFVALGYDNFSFIQVMEHVPTPYGVHNFIWNYLVLYLLIPFLNKAIGAMNKKDFGCFIGLLLLFYSVIPTLLYNNQLEWIGWYITMYFVGAYIRLYPMPWFKNKKIVVGGTVFLLIMAVLSLWGITFISRSVDQMKNFQYMVVDSHKILAFIISVFLFLTFVFHVKIGYSKVINTMALATFGVLLIHNHSDAMSVFLWKDVFKNYQYVNSPYCALHFIGVVLAVYGLCVVIDLLRIYLLEKPLFKYLTTRNNK